MHKFFSLFLLVLFGNLYSQSTNNLSENLKSEFLTQLNKKRLVENLGEIYSSNEADEIAKQVFKIKGTVDNIKLLDVLGFADSWALYDTYKITISIPDSISKYYKPEALFSRRLNEMFSQNSNESTSEWMTGSNLNKDNPYLIGFYLDESYQNKETIYKVFIISIRNIPMKYKCMEPLDD
jgi:hypothetical protein